MRKTLLPLLLLATGPVPFCSAQNYSFPYYRSVIPVYFHGGSGLSVQACYDMVDGVNNNFIASGVKFSLYVAEVDNTSPNCPVISGTQNTNYRGNGINVYMNLCPFDQSSPDGYFSNNGYFISLSSASSSVLTHELGHALGLPHPAGSCINPNWNHPGNYNDPFRIAGCYDNSADCIYDTDPNTGNWMNQGTTGTSVFTYCQHARMVEFITRKVALAPQAERRLWFNYPTSDNNYYVHGQLSTSASKFETPVPVLDLNYTNPYNCYASLKFIRPANHSTHTPANYVTVSYTTKCPSGSIPSGYSFSTTLTASLAETLSIPKSYGIDYIDYTFKTSATATSGWSIRQYVNYNSGTSCGGCYIWNGGGASRLAQNDTAEESYITKHITNGKILCSNKGFKKYYVYNMLGQNLAEGRLVEGDNTIGMADLPSGTYVVTFYDDNGKKETMLFIR